MNLRNYPLVKLNKRNFLLSIHPIWHTRLFPESILNNENSYRSAATSVCVVREVLDIQTFSNFEEFRKYCEPYSVFGPNELEELYKNKNYPIMIRFTYNFPIIKKVIRNDIMRITGYTDTDYWGFLPILDHHFKEILKLGGVNESFIID